MLHLDFSKPAELNLEFGQSVNLDGLYQQPLHGQVVTPDGQPHPAALLPRHGGKVADL